MPTSTNAQLGGSGRDRQQGLKYVCHLLGGIMILNYVPPDTIRRPGAMALNILKVKVGVLRPVQQPGSYWDRSSELPLVGLEPTEVTAYD